MSIFSELAIDADEMLAEFGDEVTLSQPVKSGDPWAAAVTMNPTQIVAAIVPISTDLAGGHVDADAMMYARPPVPISIGDAITRGTEAYRVTKLRTYVGHGVTALVKAELKWAS